MSFLEPQDLLMPMLTQMSVMMGAARSSGTRTRSRVWSILYNLELSTTAGERWIVCVDVSVARHLRERMRERDWTEVKEYLQEFEGVLSLLQREWEDCQMVVLQTEMLRARKVIEVERMYRHSGDVPLVEFLQR